MKKCPICGYEEEVCEVPKCERLAIYEGWYRVVDFAGIPTGLIQKRIVCEEHLRYLIGGRAWMRENFAIDEVSENYSEYSPKTLKI